MIEEKDKIISFKLFKVERGREKICKCNPPHLVIDVENRIVTCDDCGATLDGFEALMRIAEYMEKYEEYQKKALDRAKTYAKLADDEWNRRMKNKVFKDMDKQYQNGLYPYCPKCGEMINPVKITRWGNKKFYRESEVSE